LRVVGPDRDGAQVGHEAVVELAIVVHAALRRARMASSSAW
jgi:hypothetical protein